MQFALQTQAGVPVGAALLRDDVVVTGGVFTVELDFGASITGAALKRWRLGQCRS